MKKISPIATSLLLTVSLAFYVQILPRYTKLSSQQNRAEVISARLNSIPIDTKKLMRSLVRQLKVKLEASLDR